jgi:hypothetical protein
MGWRFRKTITQGPVRYSITKNGIGSSIGFCGFRIGSSPNGDMYFSFGIPGTGLYYIKKIGKKGSPSRPQKAPPSKNSQSEPTPQQNADWWKDQISD